VFSFFRLLGFVHRGERWHTPLARARMGHLPVILSEKPCYEFNLGKFAFGDRTIPIHARTLGPDEHNPNAMGVYYGAVQSAVVYTN